LPVQARPIRQTRRADQNLDPHGPIDGYVAQTSMTGTKTNTPLMETPQAISVVGAEQIRDQKPANVAEALRYAPDVGAETFDADTRNDWFQDPRLPCTGRRIVHGRIAAFDLRFRDLKDSAL
jgi:iron complex outermembrane receptor protein